MQLEKLNAIQTPIKERYKQHPEQAAATLRGAACLGVDVTSSIAIGNHTIETGLHPGAGGEVSNICPGEVFLSSLAACAAITLSAVATYMRLNIEGGQVAAIGSLDLRGTLGIDPAVPVGFQRIQLLAELDTNAPDEDLEKLLEMTEKYCVVLQTLVSPPKLSVQKKRI